MNYKKSYLQEKKKADVFEIQLMQMRYQTLNAEIQKVTKELEDIEKEEKQAKNDKKDSIKGKA